MGVSCAGKTSVGRQLVTLLALHGKCFHFLDGDDFHDTKSLEKMSQGQPLNDCDRKNWIEKLRHEIEQAIKGGRNLILACSALKRDYRKILNIDKNCITFVHLIVDFETARRRIIDRTGHFFNEELLQSQFDTLQKYDSSENLNYESIEYDSLSLEDVSRIICDKLKI